MPRSSWSRGGRRAWAFYAATGDGAGTGGTTGTLSSAEISVPSTSSASHTVTFTQQAALSDPSFDSQIKYRIQRKLDSGSFLDVPSGPCSGPLDYGTTSCTDTVTTAGSYTYRVVARYSGWSATSADAGPVVVTLGDNPSPMVNHITRLDDSPTNAASVDFEVEFSENVTGVDAGDFDIATTGGISGATIDNVSGSGDTYTVSVGTGTGDGTLGLNLDDDDSIQDSVEPAARRALGRQWRLHGRDLRDRQGRAGRPVDQPRGHRSDQQRERLLDRHVQSRPSPVWMPRTLHFPRRVGLRGLPSPTCRARAPSTRSRRTRARVAARSA